MVSKTGHFNAGTLARVAQPGYLFSFSVGAWLSLVEHLLGVQEVAGSSPVAPTNSSIYAFSPHYFGRSDLAASAADPPRNSLRSFSRVRITADRFAVRCACTVAGSSPVAPTNSSIEMDSLIVQFVLVSRLSASRNGFSFGAIIEQFAR